MNYKKIVVAIPFSHTWLWGQTCLASLKHNPPVADGFDVTVVVVDNSWSWSPAIRGIRDTALGEGVAIIDNPKSNRFHASALDCIVETFNFDYLMALETDVLALRPGWLQWFVDQMKWSDFAVGMFHHEQFVNPSCTLYRGSVLRDMLEWSRPDGSYRPEHAAPQDELRWGPDFSLSAPLDSRFTPDVLNDPRDLQAAIEGFKSWVAGPFAEKRGFLPGTVMAEPWSGQLKGPGWMEPGQQLHHWATNRGFTYTICLTTTVCRLDNMPLVTQYGVGKGETVSYPTDLQDQKVSQYTDISTIQTAHFWGGTRALDILKHQVTCGFVRANTPAWLAREARFWKAVVPADVQAQTLDLIRKYGFHYRGQGNDYVTDRDREAAEFVRGCYAEGGVTW